jgi:hypothetical protein
MLKKIIKAIVKWWTCPPDRWEAKCPECGGVMNVDDCEITQNMEIIDVYICQKCKREWI